MRKKMAAAAELEIDTICEHPGDHVFHKGRVYKSIKDKPNWYLGEWEICPDCKKPICGFCMASGFCHYSPVSDYASPKIFIKPTTRRSRVHKTGFMNGRR